MACHKMLSEIISMTAVSVEFGSATDFKTVLLVFGKCSKIIL